MRLQPVQPDDKKATDFYRLIFESVRDPILVASPEGHILDANRAILETLGYSKEELLGMTIVDLRPPSEKPKVGQHLRKGRSGAVYETLYMRKDGSVFPVEISTREVMIGDKAVYPGVIRDITERKRVEGDRERLLKEVEEQRARLQAILDSLPVGVWIADASGKVLTINKAGHDIVGGQVHYANEINEYRAYKTWWADTGEPIAPEDFPLARSILYSEYVKDEVIDFEHQDGSRATHLVSSAPIRSSRGEDLGAVSVVQDITRLKKTEADLRDSKAQAELYLDLLGHDISNLHQILLMQLEQVLGILDEEGWLEGKDRKLLETPVKTLEQSASLINNIRKLQKVQSGEYRAELIDMGRVIEDVVKMYSALPGRDITIGYQPAPGQMVLASPLLRDIFINLVDNAVKHSSDPVVVEIDVSRIEQKGLAYYRVSVADHGRGIPDEQKGLLFRRLKRGQTTSKGTGLGLYIVRTLAESFGGTADVEDRVPGDFSKGAKFNVYLPVAAGTIDEW